MSRTVLAIVSGGEDEANERVERLRNQFGDFSFEVEPHDRKHQIVLTAGDASTPNLETMKGVAQGYGGSTEDREKEAAPKTVKPAPVPSRGPQPNPGTPTPSGGAANPAATPAKAT